MDAIQFDLAAWKHVPFGGASGDQDFVLMGLDWSGAVYAMQVRANQGDGGAPYANLTNAAAGSEGIYATYDAGYIHPVTGETVGATRIRPQINQTTLEAIPLAADDPSAALVLAYDIQVTPPGLPPMLFFWGQFTINPGATV